MYLKFFNLDKEPFHITPDPDFLFLSPSHKEALASIVYGIEKRKGFIAIMGGVGVGKTTLLRSYLQKADKEHLKIVYLFNASISFTELLDAVCERLGIEPDSQIISKKVNALNRGLIEEYGQGNNVVLVVDEAQNMPIETIESLRMLSNLETTKEKLIQIVLIGQPEFDTLLNRHEMRQLRQRLAVRSIITPLNKKESHAYIQHRLKVAGYNPGRSKIFTPGALREIVRCADGIPRVINTLCDNALINGYGYNKKPITTKIAREAISDFQGKPKKHQYLRWATTTAAAVIVLWIGLFLFPIFGDLTGSLDRKVNQQMFSGNQELKKPFRVVEEGEQVGIKKTENFVSKGFTGKYSEQKEKAEQSDVEVRIVQDGDTITKLTQDVYGRVDEELIRLVHEHNNHIPDVDIINVGMKVIFPKPNAVGHGKRE